MKLVVLNRQGLLQTTGATPEVYPQVPEALAKLCAAGFTLVVASNEPGIGLGDLDLDDLEAAHLKLNDLVENRGGAIAAFFYCPHTAADQCHCRKPNTGLIDAIELEFATPANDMLLITNQLTDLELANAIGAEALFVQQGAEVELSQDDESTLAFATMPSAIDFALRNF